MADPIYLFHCLLAAGMFVFGLMLIMDGIAEDRDADT
jgi:hypothetical protein